MSCGLLTELPLFAKLGPMKKADPIVALVAGVILFFVSAELAKTVIAVYLIVIGVLGLLKK